MILMVYAAGIRLKPKEKSLKALKYLHCMKPSDEIAYENCYWDELRDRVSAEREILDHS